MGIMGYLPEMGNHIVYVRKELAFTDTKRMWGWLNNKSVYVSQYSYKASIKDDDNNAGVEPFKVIFEFEDDAIAFKLIWG